MLSKKGRTVPEPKIDSLAKILETDDKDLQVERVKQIIQLASSPVFVLVITYDPRKGEKATNVDSVGQPINTEVAFALLEEARKVVHSQITAAKTETPEKTDGAD